MRSAKRGKVISGPEVVSISRSGLWLVVGRREYFASYEHFPWFASAPASAIFAVEQVHEGHLYWPQLDIDLAVASLEEPERFPLIAAHK